jgi:hypothetical protein
MIKLIKSIPSQSAWMNTAVSLLLTASLFSCSTPPRVIGTWISPEAKQADHRKVKKVFINVMLQNEAVKSELESDLADAIASKGIQSEKSYFLFGPVRSRENLPPHDLLIKQIKKLECDAIFIVSVIDQSTQERYYPGTALYTPYNAYGTFNSFYGYSSVVYTPGYYSVEKTYYLQSNLYDTDTEKLLLSMQTKVINPSSIEKSAKEYTKALIAELEKQGLLKK